MIALLSLFGCTPGVPRLPSQGGAPWFEWKTEHFMLWSDAPPERGRELVVDLEFRRRVILDTLRTSSSLSAFVIAVRDRIELGEYQHFGYVGSAWDSDNMTGQPGMFFAADDVVDDVVPHEVAHVISREIAAYQPAWLAEGIATYFETMQPLAQTGVLRVGVPRGDRLRFLLNRFPVNAEDLFGCDRRKCQDYAFYATSWATVAFLLDRHPETFARYRRRLDQIGQTLPRKPWYGGHIDATEEEANRDFEGIRVRLREDARRAWREEFRDLPLDKLDRELRSWLFAGHVQLPHIPMPTVAVSPVRRALSDADVLAVRGFLGFRYTDDNTASRADIEQALVRDRTNVLARLIQAALSHTVALDDARATVAAHPEDWRALRLLELAQHGTPEGDAARARMCERSSNTPPECAPAARAQD
jgi:hypothetical protein